LNIVALHVSFTFVIPKWDMTTFFERLYHSPLHIFVICWSDFIIESEFSALIDKYLQISSLKQALLVLVIRHAHLVLQQYFLVAIPKWTQGFEVTIPKSDALHKDINTFFRDEQKFGTIENMFC